MTTNYFARYIGLPCGENLYRIKRGNNGISRDVANRIVAKFPEISKGWLMTGEGAMLRNQGPKELKIPFFEGRMHDILNNLDRLEPSHYFSLPGIGDCDLALEYAVDETAMADEKIILLLQRVDHDELLAGKIYVFAREEQTRLRKWDPLDLSDDNADSIYMVKGRLMVNR